MEADNFMRSALNEARRGLAEGGIPIGAVLVKDGRIIGRGHNQRVQKNDPVLHAEIHCLQNAGRLGSYRDTVLYSTLMPCYLCSGAIVQFGIAKVVAGESRTFAGARVFLEEHGVSVTDLDLPECRELMSAFIRQHPDLWNEDIGVTATCRTSRNRSIKRGFPPFSWAIIMVYNFGCWVGLF